MRLRERTQLQDAAKEATRTRRCGQRSAVPLSRYQITQRPFSVNTQTQTQTHARTQRDEDSKDDGPKQEDQEEQEQEQEQEEE